jgi:RNA polymerase sigma-70 factor (ECF subfamily)
MAGPAGKTALASGMALSLRGPGLASDTRSAFSSAMNRIEEIDGLQRVVLNERRRLLRFLAARGAGDEAEDVLHDLWQRVAGLAGRPIADPVSYVFRAAENLMRDRRRSEVSRAQRQHDWHDTSISDHEEPQGERRLIARQRLGEVDAVLAALGPRVEQVFRRYRLEGIGQGAIARELGISLSSVEKDLQKAYGALANLKAKFDAE